MQAKSDKSVTFKTFMKFSNAIRCATWIIIFLGFVFSDPGATLVWTNTTGGAWSSSLNWNPNQVPGSTDNALITNAGTYTVTLDTSPSVGSLSVGGGAGQQTLATANTSLTLNGAGVVNPNGTFALTNNGTLAGTGSLRVNGLFQWAGGQINEGMTVTIGTNGSFVLAGANGSSYNMAGMLTNAGTVQLVSGTLQLYDYNGNGTGWLVNEPSGVVEFTADVPIGASWYPEFVNQGRLVKSGGTGTSLIQPYFSNSGTVAANCGTISINGLGAAFADGSQFIGGGQTALNGNTVTLGGSLLSSNLVLAGAGLAGNGTLNGVLTWTSGQINYGCGLTVNPGSVLVLAGANGSSYLMAGMLTNAGTVQLVSGTLQLYDVNNNNTGWLVNEPAGVVSLATDVSIGASWNPVLVNQGALVKSGGTGTSSIQPYLINSGTVEANIGTITLNDLGATLAPGSQFLGAGQTTLTAGTVTLAGAVISSNLVLAGSSLAGHGSLNGALTWTDGQINYGCSLTISPNSILTLAGANGSSYLMAGMLTNAGTVQLVSGTLQLYDVNNNNTGWLVNEPAGVVALTADVSIGASWNPEFLNQGTLVKSGGTNTSSIQPYLVNNGTVEANTGTIVFNDLGATLATGSQFLGTGQTVLAAGTVTLAGSVVSSNLMLAGASLAGNGSLDGVLTWTSGQINQGCGLTVNPGSVLMLAGANGTPYYVVGMLTNAGTLQLVSGNLQLYDVNNDGTGGLINEPSGVVELAADVSIGASWNPELVNQGTLVKSGGTNTSTIQPLISNLGGAIGSASGTLSFNGNNLVQNGGTLFVDLGGTNAGQSGMLAGIGNAALQGLLTVTLTNGYVPPVGSAFQAMAFSSYSGKFAPLNIPAGMSVSYSNTGVYLNITNPLTLAPAITEPPTNNTVPYAGSTQFSVAATGMTPLNYQWLKNGVALSDRGAISGSGTPDLTLNEVTDNNAGNYSVVISNAYGVVTSSIVVLTVLDCTTPAPGLVSWWPGNGTALDIISGNNGVLTNDVSFAPAEVGEGFVFTNDHAGVVIGNPADLQLQSFTIEAWIQRGTTNAASTDPTAANGSGLIFGYGQHGYGFGMFPNGTLLLSQIDDTEISAAAAVTDTNLHHVAVSAGGGIATFYVDGVAYPAAGSYHPTYTFTTPAAIGARADHLNTNNNDSFFGTINELSVYNTALSSNEIAAVYGAGAAGKCLSQAPAVTGEPQSLSVALGGTATFTVETTGLLPQTNQWRLNGVNLSDNGRIAGSQNNVLVLTNVQFTDAGTYLVTVTNMVGGTISQPATLTVLRKTPVVTWSNATAILYGTALNNQQLNATASVPGTFTYNPPAGTVLGAGSFLLGVAFTPADSTDYQSVTLYVSLTVTPAPLAVTAHNATRAYGQTNPVFTGTIVGLQGLDNLAAQYTCGAVPASPPGTYPIVPSLYDPYGRLANYTVAVTNGTLTVNAAAPPSLVAVMPAQGSTNGGQIVTLTGTNFETGASVTFGSATATSVNVNSPMLLTLLTPAAPPGIVNVTIQNPDGNQTTLNHGFTYGVAPLVLAQPLGESIVVGSNAVFNVQASGEGTLSYQWQFNGATLLNLGGFSGARTATLTISNVALADAGSYQVVITNAFGSLVSTSAVLTVLTPPTVTAPQAVAVGIGGAASFSVTAGGTSPFGFQWYQGASPVVGATSPTLNLPNVQTTNQGQYTVVVTNLVGSVTSSPALLTVLGYCADAQTAESLYPVGTTVPITVQTYNCGSQAAQASSVAVLWIYASGTTRTIALTTATNGSAVVNFAPLAGEAGLVQYAAALPGVNNPPAQGSFTLIGLSALPASSTPVLTVGYPLTNIITLSNLTSVALAGLTASVVGGPANINVQVSIPPSLPGNATAQAVCVLTASGNVPNQAPLNIQITAAQGTTNTVPLSASVVRLQPDVVAIPAQLHANMVPGGQTLVTFNLENLGGMDTGPMQVLLPGGAPWLSAVTAQPLVSLAPGQSNLVTVALTPSNNMVLGPYSGSLIIAGPTFQSEVPFTFDCVSTAVGSLLVTAHDEFTLLSPGAPNLSNATVTVTDYLTGSNLASAVTGPAGTALFTNLTSAYYSINVTATNHGEFNTTLLVQGNETNAVIAFLPDNLVSYSWVVTPTTIPDNYDFVLTTTFQTQVPWPVVTIQPGAINLCQFGGTNQVDLVISNNGLISAQGLVLSFGSNANWSIVPLANNLGDLAAESSIVVPVILTQIGESTAAASSIAAQLNWHVFTPTQSNYYTTPIFVYNANPNDCTISSTPVVNVGGGGGGSGGGGGGGGGGGQELPVTPGYVNQPTYSFASPITGAIVDVTLQIDQHAVIARDAFKATLQLNNTAGSTISDLQVTINPVDASGNSASNLFAIVPPTLTGLNAVDGTGTLAEDASGTASWTIIPATNAAPTAPTQFAIGGTLSYVLDGQQVVIPLFAVPITVLPSPVLNVDYFLQHDVYSQDPFTTQVEPSVPFGLGIMVHNDGLGVCDDFTITSAQPTIIANSNGLLIAFELIGSQAGTNQMPSPSLTMDLGSIPAGDDVTGLWLMTSTLEGAFISYSATFSHVNALGTTNTSLVNSVKIHAMNHIVRITVPDDDGIPDFLVNDTTNVDALPDDVYSSTGPVFPVTSLTNVIVYGSPSVTQSNITITVSAPPGWAYLQFPDPSGGAMTIASVQRSDGVSLLVGPNVWQTPQRIHMLPPQSQALVHLFDYNSTGSYTITYGSAVTAPTVTTLAAVATNSVSATLNALVNPDNGDTTVYFQWGLTTNYSGITPPISLTQSLDTPQDASLLLEGLQPNATYHYQAVAENNAGTSFGGDVTFTTPLVTPPVITQAPYVTIAVGQNLVVTNNANTPVTWSLDPVCPAGSSIDTNGIFQWTPACDQGSTTNIVTLWATDVQYPSVSNHMTFLVTVGDCVELSAGSVALLTGQDACIPIDLQSSSLPLNDLQFTLRFPANQVADLSISSTNDNVGAAIMISSSPTQAVFSVTALTGRSLQGPANIANVCFQASGQHSAFVPLTLAGIQGTSSSRTLVGNSGGSPGQLVLVAGQPLLQAGLGTNNSTLVITLYGAPGSNYVLQTVSALGGNWQSNSTITLSNIITPIVVGVATNGSQFYRAYWAVP